MGDDRARLHDGARAQYPELVAVVMQTAASDWAAARLAVAIERVAVFVPTRGWGPLECPALIQSIIAGAAVQGVGAGGVGRAGGGAARDQRLDQHRFRPLGKLVVGNLDRIADVDDGGD